MRIGRLIGTGAVLVVVAAGCGSGDDGGGEDASSASEEEAGVTLEDWAAQADEICAEADQASDELELETTADLVERGEEALEISEEALEDLEDLEQPAGEDGQRAADLVEALSEMRELQEEVLGELGDGEDELALLEITLENEELVDDGAEAAEEAATDDCQEAFTERQDQLAAIQELFDEAGELSEVRVGDCLAGLEDGDLRVASCGPDAEAEVRTTAVSSTGCPDELVGRGSGGINFCLELLVGPEDEDEHLVVGSCLLLEDAEQDTVDVTELPCGDDGVTHVIVRSVRRAQECGPDDRRFDKTPQEIARSGRGEWCAQPAI